MAGDYMKYGPLEMLERLEKVGFKFDNWNGVMRFSDKSELRVDLTYCKKPEDVKFYFSSKGITREYQPAMDLVLDRIMIEVIMPAMRGEVPKQKIEEDQTGTAPRQELKKISEQEPKSPQAKAIEPEIVPNVPTIKDIGMAISAEKMPLTIENVRKYLCKEATDEEAMIFIQLCAYRNLNPWTKEVYFIKYDKNSPATMVVGIDALQKRAEQHDAYDGLKSGIIIKDQSEKLQYREGTLKLIDENLVGGWAEVFRKDRTKSTRVEVALEEYIQITIDGKPTRFWNKMPATMIRKVAKAQALREAFATEFGGLYAMEELGVST